MAETFFDLSKKIFRIKNADDFNQRAIEVYNYQYQNNIVYKQYCDLLGRLPETVNNIQNIPFLPISFFKTKVVKTENFSAEIIFSSSGTTGMVTSRHHLRSLSLYRQSFSIAFEQNYGQISQYIVVGLLPSYLERDGSSLVYMVNQLISESNHPNSGFYLNNLAELADFLATYKGNRKIMLIGVSYALLDLAENFNLDLSNCVVMETGGMKGKRKEMTKPELHAQLKTAFKTDQIHSEYGMTELLSQAYAKSDGQFHTPPWMKVLIREHNDPFAFTNKKSGGINIIDLANLSTCAFIATDDLGKVSGNHFEVLGRFDFADLRGCNLLVQ
ncbi:MAG: acyl transferase [Putridiphycobacter sp.]|nr:acyl transferase [Putridiphycobacter sp.]